MKNGRLVGIDYGTKRVGVAVSDPLRIFAQPFGTFSPDQVVAVLEKIRDADGLAEIIIGWPLTESGESGRAVRRVENFANRLKKAFPAVPVIAWDERYSSSIALKKLIDSGMGKKARSEKGRIDRAAAAVILQEYMDAGINDGDETPAGAFR